jgi:hypothetical protein
MTLLYHLQPLLTQQRLLGSVTLPSGRAKKSEQGETVILGSSLVMAEHYRYTLTIP